MTNPGTGSHQTLDEQRLRSLARPDENGLLRSEFHVPAMHCSGCMRKVEAGLATIGAVKAARANLSTKRVHVTWDGDVGRATDIQSKFEDLGFDATVFQMSDLGSGKADQQRNRLLLSLGVAGFAAANIMLLSVSVWSGADGETKQLFHLISGMIAVPAIAYAGHPFFSSAAGALRRGRMNMDVPISLAVLIATAMSLYESLVGGEHAYFDAATMLLFFLLIGRTLDHMMRERARGAAKTLAGLAAKGGVRISENGKHDFVPLDAIRPGDRLAIAAGERVPVDGVVAVGRTDVDRSLVTGESALLEIAPGGTLEAGVLNITSPIELRATKSEDGSFLAEVVRLMEAAESGKARFVRIADRAARTYAPFVHALALAAFVGWLIATGGDWHTSLYIAIAVLIITCPCALGLAVPIVHVIAAGRLFAHGVMVKDGAALERFREIDTVVFDKTGTLTLGQPRVVSSSDVADQGALVAALAKRSSHPMAKAVASFLGDQADVVGNVDEIQEVPGLGIQATVDGRMVRLGRHDWACELSSAASIDAATTSTVWFCEQGRTPCHFELEDSLRPGARSVMDRLRAGGLSLEIVSGDADQPVKTAASALAITTVASRQTPQDKIHHIEALQDEGRKVLMVGDGLNDAPALAAAHVSMTPSSGSDVGRQSADLIFTHVSLDSISFARDIAVRADKLVRQNIAIAIAYNFIAVPIALAGFVTPLVAAIAMSSSSILVVANSMRLQLKSRSDGLAANSMAADVAAGTNRPMQLMSQEEPVR